MSRQNLGLSRFTALLIALICAGDIAASGASITWTNTAGGLWSDSNNWLPQQVPGRSDDALLTTPGAYTVLVDADVSVNNLTIGANSGTQILSNDVNSMTIVGLACILSNGVMSLGGGVLFGPGILSVGDAGRFEWNGDAVLHTPLTVASNGVVAMQGFGNKVSYVSVTNFGTIIFASTAGNLYLYGTPIINGGLFDIQTDAVIAAYYALTNTGTLRKSAGPGSAYITRFDNSGTVEVQSGSLRIGVSTYLGGTFLAQSGTTLNFTGGGTLDGTFTAAAAATITLTDGSFGTGPNVQFGGDGTNSLAGASVTVDDLIPNLELLRGTLGLSPLFQGGSLTNFTLAWPGIQLTAEAQITGTFTWLDGSIAGSFTVASNGVLNIQGSSDNSSFAAITNLGTINYSNAGAIYLYGPVINSELFDIQTDQTINSYAMVFTKAGTVRKSAGTGTAYITRMDNYGAVEVESGTLRIGYSIYLGGSFVVQSGASLELIGGGTLDGIFTAAPAASINLTGGSFIIGPNAQFDGLGTNTLAGGSLTLDAPMPNLQLLSGSLAFGALFQGGSLTNFTLTSPGIRLRGDTQITGTFNWLDGSISGSLTIASNAVLNIQGSSVKVSYAAVTNWGVINYSNIGAIALYGPTINNGLFDIQTDQIINTYENVFSESGTLRKSAGSGTAYITRLENFGAVEVESGVLRIGASAYLGGTYLAQDGTTLDLTGGGTLDGIFTAAQAGSINLKEGSFLVGPNLQFEGAGANRLAGASVTLDALVPNLQLVSGSVVLSALFQGGSLTNFTLAWPGIQLRGQISITGTFNWLDGSIGDPVTVATSGLLNIQGSSDKSLNAAITNAGAITYQNAGTLYVSGVIVNAGFFDLQTDQTINTGGGFINVGSFRRTTGVGTAAVSTFDNLGKVEAQSGLLNFGNFQSSSASSLSFGLSGTNNGIDYGQVGFAGHPALKGKVDIHLVASFLPQAGDAFYLITTPLGSMCDAWITGRNLGDGFVLQLTGNVGLALVTVAIPNSSQPLLSIRHCAQSPAAILIEGEPGQTYHLEVSPGLTAPDWTELLTTNAPGGVVEFVDLQSLSAPSRFYRVRLE